jgi:ketosteroid isomerase-like protein
MEGATGHDISPPWSDFVSARERGDTAEALRAIREFIRVWDEAFWSNDFSSFHSVYTDDVVLANSSRVASLIGSQERIGVDGFRRLRDDMADAFRFFRFYIDEVRRPRGDRVLALGHIRARGRYTGLVLRTQFAALWTLRGEKICRADGFSSHRKALAAAGLPATGDVEEEWEGEQLDQGDV